jgi:hypothetical protein
MRIAKKGTRPSEECIRKSLEVRMSHPVSEETRLKLSLANKGKCLSEEHKRNISLGSLGKKMSEEAKKKIGDANRGRICTKDAKRINRESHLGLKQSKESNLKRSVALKGSKSYLWKGGVSYEPYCPKFNKEFKKRVRDFFGNRCAGCGKQTVYNLHVHHVNFNKMSCTIVPGLSL